MTKRKKCRRIYCSVCRQPRGSSTPRRTTSSLKASSKRTLGARTGVRASTRRTTTRGVKASTRGRSTTLSTSSRGNASRNRGIIVN